jgi:hypothetical protein
LKKGRNNEVSTLFDSGPALEEAALFVVIKPHDELGTIGAMAGPKRLRIGLPRATSR